MNFLKMAILSSGLMFPVMLLAGPPLANINSDLPEYALVKGPDGWYFSRSTEAFGQPGKEQILMVPLAGGLDVAPVWTDTDYSEGDVYFSPDGHRFCFASDRPSADDPDPGDTDIWCAERSGDQWTEPLRMPEPVNSAGIEFSPVLTADANIYFASNREGGQGQGDLYRAYRDEFDSWQVENLGPNVNSAQGEWNLDVSPDGEYLIFEASGRASNLSVPGDLYLSRKTPTGWSAGIPLSVLNTRGSELMPRFLSADEVAYASSDGDDADILVRKLEDFLPVEGMLAAVSRSAHELVLLDPASLEIRQRLALGAGTHEMAASADGRVAIAPSLGVYPEPHEQPILPGEMRWTSSESTGYTLLSLAGGSTQQVSLDDCSRPHGAAIRAQAARAWVTCEDLGQVLELEPRTGEVLKRYQLGKGVHKVMLLESAGVLVTSNPDEGEVGLVSLSTGEISLIETGKGAEALAASQDQRVVWVANGFEASVCKISTAEKTVLGCWPSGGKFPIALAVDEQRELLWIARSASSDVAALSLDTLETVHEFPLPSPPLGMALDEAGGRLYLTLPRLNEVVGLNIESGEIVVRAGNIMEADDLDLIPALDYRQSPDCVASAIPQ